jgi:hypothetical protein
MGTNDVSHVLILFDGTYTTSQIHAITRENWTGFFAPTCLSYTPHLRCMLTSRLVKMTWRTMQGPPSSQRTETPATKSCNCNREVEPTGGVCGCKWINMQVVGSVRYEKEMK